jgi:RimJ/RimL family protein N-acetyltransferase
MEPIILRQWRESDLEPLAAMNNDPEVMRHFPALIGREQSAAWLQRQRGLIEEQGWGLWALDVGGELAGFVGLAVPRFEAAFMPCVEVGWRLRREYWGRSIAWQGAQHALSYGFEVLRLPQIVSFTAVGNLRSRRLMERLGFIHDAASDFDHPSLPVGHELRHHVFYRKNAS